VAGPQAEIGERGDSRRLFGRTSKHWFDNLALRDVVVRRAGEAVISLGRVVAPSYFYAKAVPYDGALILLHRALVRDLLRPWGKPVTAPRTTT
jgi:hypothetical protein